MPGVLFRVAVLESPGGYTMIFTHHHAVLDGRSLKILFTEVFEDYAAICEGATKQFDRSRRYRDFVDWWQRLDLSQARQFWSRFLDGVAQPAVSLPGAIGAIADSGSGGVPQPRRPRDRMAEPTAREMVFDLDFSASLRDAARRHGVTIATLVNAAWAVVLGRYRASDDVLFAVTRSCRYGAVEGADQMVGLLINSVPLRVNLDPALTIGDLLMQVYQRGTQVREHQLAPLGDIQRWGGVPAGMPDTLVVFDRERLGSTLAKIGPQFANRTVTMHRLPSFTTTLYGFDEPAIRILLIFDQHQFDNHTAGAVLGHVRRILEAFAGDPSVQLADIDLADEAERNRVVSIWNQTRFRYPRDATVPECFARQAAATPDAVAVSFGGATLTYAELDARANQLAHELRDRGVGLETPVAVALPRSLDLVVALLAVMKAGGAYVPLDLANPPARSAYVLSDCGARLVITEAALSGHYGDIPVLRSTPPPGSWQPSR